MATLKTLLFLGAVGCIGASDESSVNQRWRPHFHYAPPHGWMNDPNGFSHFRGEYHLFYQYNPKTSLEPGIAHWGHTKSKDLFNWIDVAIALYPDEAYDVSGVFSGSAITVNDSMVLIYTGNINHPNADPDHEQHQNLAFSKDGVKFHKYPTNPVIVGSEHQPDFRDPKIWKHNDTYYVVLGNSKNDLGKTLLYASDDIFNWNQVAVLAESNGFLGSNWECPDFFELDGRFVLLFSPQGMNAQGDKYRNLYQTGYIIGKFDYNTHKFTQETEFQELDAGHDLYASQTMLTEDGRRVSIAWMDMWEQVYPERADGWTGQMTLPRTLHIAGNRILQKPVEEFESLIEGILYSERAEPGNTIPIKSNIAAIKLRTNESTVGLEFNWGGNTTLTLSYADGKVSLSRGAGEDDLRRAQWEPKGEIEWRIFIDRSSVELFCGEGELVFSSRFFPTGSINLQVMEDSSPVDLHIEAIRSSVAVTVFPSWMTILLSSVIYFKM